MTTKPVFALTPIEAAYVVAAMRIALDHLPDGLPERDYMIMNAIMDKLAAPLDLSAEVKARLDTARRRS
jgi:hypothetical protein